MDIQKTIKEIKEWEEYLGLAVLLDPERTVFEWHKRTVFRMNFYIAQVKLIEKQHERIGIEIPPNHELYEMYNRELNNAIYDWEEAVGRKAAYFRLKQLQSDLNAYLESQDKWSKQTVLVALKAGNQQLSLMF